MLHRVVTQNSSTHVNASPRGDNAPSLSPRVFAAEFSSVSIAHACLILALGYAAISIYDFYVLPEPHNITLFVLAGLTSGTLLALYLLNRLVTFPDYIAHPLFILVAFLILGNVVTQCVILEEEKYLTNFMLITTGVSLVFFSWRMLILFYVLVIGSFAWTLQYIHPAPDYTQQFFVMGCSFLIGILSVSVRKNVLHHLLLTRALAQSKSERLQEALAESQRGIKAQQENHSKSNFLAHMSHELRTPLTAIIGFSDIIKLELFGSLRNDRYADYISDIHTSSEHLLSLVNDILDLSKLEENMVDVHLTSVDLGETLERSLSMVRERARKNNLTLEHTPLDGEPVIYSDPLRLKQIVLNLLSNAVKFTPSGGLVSLETHFDPSGTLIIEVRDTGVGMSEAEIANAREPFWQAKAYRSSPTEGTGLGLSLSKELAELLGGRLEIESAPNVGTTARLVLPYEAIQNPAHKKPSEDREPREGFK